MANAECDWRIMRSFDVNLQLRADLTGPDPAAFSFLWGDTTEPLRWQEEGSLERVPRS